jgi:hypothetical protein
MSLRNAIHEVLSTNPEVVALIGQRHFRTRAPQNTERPHLVSQIILDPGVVTHGHSDDGEDKQSEALVRFTAVADDADAAHEIISEVRKCFLDPLRTECRSILTAAHIVVTSPVERELDPNDEAAAEPVFGHQLDLTFFHNPST